MPTTSTSTSLLISKTTQVFNKIYNSSHTKNNKIISRTTIIKINNSSLTTMARMSSSIISLTINNNND